MPDAVFTFPSDFLWGTATSAHQVEGNNTNNDWWEWEQRGEGRVFGDHTSGAACDWWKGRAEEDIKRMADLGTNAHRLSIEWSRIEPQEGEWNYEALDRYRNILAALRSAGIEPMVTLHHFTNPTWVSQRGGWLHPDSPKWFDRFAKKAVGDLYDQCDSWCTINEPNVYASQGYFVGKWPPGVSNMNDYFRVVRNMLIAHAAAYRSIHAIQPLAKVGLAKHMVIWKPRSRMPQNRLVASLLDRAFNQVTFDALSTGRWRPIGSKSETLPDLQNTLDWIGLNYYTRQDAWFSLRALSALGIRFGPNPAAPKGPEGWGELYPQGIYECIMRLDKQFGLPIAITETGVPDELDKLRPAWILESLRHVWQAVMHSIPVTGYYFWSLLDNFEWAEGYDPRFRFGLYGVDFESQERALRKSGELYAEIAGSGTISSDMTRRYAPQIFDRLFPK